VGLAGKLFFAVALDLREYTTARRETVTVEVSVMEGPASSWHRGCGTDSYYRAVPNSTLSWGAVMASSGGIARLNRASSARYVTLHRRSRDQSMTDRFIPNASTILMLL